MWCDELGSPLTAALCRAFAENAETDGVCARLAATIPQPHRKRATALRLAGALHHGVLTRASETLKAAYPVGRDDWDMKELWPIAKAYLESRFDEVAEFIKSDPQTNETRRSIALLPGFMEIARQFPGLPLHLYELGASAGLNQCIDQFSYGDRDWQILPRPLPSHSVSIRTEWQGMPPTSGSRSLIASRSACDLNPIDVTDPAARLRLKSYTWADQAERLTRLDAAMALAAENGVRVDKADAADWLDRKLSGESKQGVRVIFHSVFLHYPPASVRNRIQTAIDTAGQGASEQTPVAWLCMEPASVFEKDNPRLGVFNVRLQTWPGGEVKILGETDGHVTYFKAL